MPAIISVVGVLEKKSLASNLNMQLSEEQSIIMIGFLKKIM